MVLPPSQGGGFEEEGGLEPKTLLKEIYTRSRPIEGREGRDMEGKERMRKLMEIWQKSGAEDKEDPGGGGEGHQD